VESNEEFDSGRNGQSYLRGSRPSKGASSCPGNRLNSAADCGAGNGPGIGEGNLENDSWGNGHSDLDRNWGDCGGDGGGDFPGVAL